MHAPASRPLRGPLLVALLLALVGPAPALAQPSPDSRAAQQHYVKGREAASRGDHATAARELRAAYDLTGDPALLREIADAEEAGGRPREAAATLRRYLEQTPPPADAEDVRARVERLEQAAAAGPAPGATVEPRPEPGNDVEEPVSLPRGALGAGVPTFLDEPPRWQRTAAWISVGVAATLAATSGVLAASASSREDDIERLLAYRDPFTGQPATYTGRVREDYEDGKDEGETLERWSLYTIAAAGGAAVAATVFFLIDPGPETDGEEAPALGRGARVVPWAGEDGFGVTAGVSF